MHNGTLSIVATPIGNLEDITFRAVRVLKEAEVIYAEQPNVTKRLLQHYDISTHPVKLNQHASKRAMGRIIAALEQGKNIAYVTSAGTPGISDPGARLVSVVRAELPDVDIIPIPGPTALTALASVAGVPVDRFHFLGFPPHKKGRKTYFKRVGTFSEPVLFYESPHRIQKAFLALAEVLEPETFVVVGRELTKQFEEIQSGTFAQVAKWVAETSPRGEYTVLIHTKR